MKAMAKDAREQWAELAVPWRAAFELAWESFAAGSPPVGAIVVRRDGSIVTRGRSRRAELHAPTGQIAGSRLSHAEVNALAQVPVSEDRDFGLLVTLEPCFLCVAATAMSHVGALSFAGADPMWRFLNRLPELHPVLAERWFRLEGPMPGPFGLWGSLLPLLERCAREPTGTRVDAFNQEAGGLVRFAQELVASGRAENLRHMTLVEAMVDVWPDLGELDASGP
jgi:tRNA(Arg) A34 adenosine deaminase TadA